LSSLSRDKRVETNNDLRGAQRRATEREDTEMEESKRRWGDRRDATLLRDADSMHFIMGVVYPNRPDNEAYISERVDLENVKAFLAKKNYEGIEFKYTFFHVVLTALVKTITLRPKLNRFYKNENYYQRHEVTAGFTMKKRFEDHAEEGLAFLHAKPEDTIDTVHEELMRQITGYRADKHDKTGDAMDLFNRLPRGLSKFIVHILMWFDKHGWVPQSLIANDANYASVFLTNLGSIQCDAVYHHLNNYGTNSIMISVGTIHKEELIMPDGHKEIRDVVNIGATVDERIADGFYFARSIKLVKHVFAHPELLDLPLSENSGYDYK
jgi:hypothetical protein